MPKRARGRKWLRFRYLCWKIVHPFGSYGAFYSAVIADGLARGVPHRTLGTETWTRANAPAWMSLEFARRGVARVAELENFGLTRDSVCVDYGCGSLRIGQHLIRVLAPGHYWGLDVTDRFFREALAVLPPDLISRQAPHLHVIDEDILASFERRPPDFVFSCAVIKHVPPRELDAFFDRFMRLVGPRTIALIYFPDTPTTMRIAPMSWGHPSELLIRKILMRYAAAAVGVTRIGPWKKGQRRHPRSVLWIAGPDVDWRMPTNLSAVELVSSRRDSIFTKISNAAE